MSSARELLDIDEVLAAEVWASGWLGQAWLDAELGDREPEDMLCTEVTGRACTRPSPRGRAAIAALRLVGPPSVQSMLDETLEILADQPANAWETQQAWEPVSAARATSVWDDEHIVFVEYAGPRPHTVMVAIGEVGGTVINHLDVLEPGAAAAFESLTEEPGEVPMPVAAVSVDDALREIATALRRTDMYWPRHEEQDYVKFRALVWSRARPDLQNSPDWEPISDTDREAVVRAFDADSGLDDDTVTRSLAELFIDYANGYLPDPPLGWSPGWVQMFLLDYLPRKVALDSGQLAAMPEALRAWVRFTGTRRDLDPQWVQPMIDTVDDCLPEFTAAFDDTSSWGPAKQIAAQLTERGIDLTDHDAVEEAISTLNAENLARHVLDSE
jgi:hypothetical protein